MLHAPKADTYQPADQGLQPERTTMGWTRTSTALLVVSLGLLHWLGEYGVWLLGLCVLGLLISLTIQISQARHYRRVDAAVRHGGIAPALLPVLALSFGVVVFAFTAMILILTGPTP